jgi:prevent-host-death family protein
MDVITIHAAKSNLSRLIARVEAGEEIILARGKLPVARLVPFPGRAASRQFGALQGIVTVDKAFFDPLPPDELAAWET